MGRRTRRRPPPLIPPPFSSCGSMVDWSGPGIPLAFQGPWRAPPVPGVPDGYHRGERPGEEGVVRALELGVYRRGTWLPSAPSLPARAPDPQPAWAPGRIELPLPRRIPRVWWFPAWRHVPELWFVPAFHPHMAGEEDPEAVALIWAMPERFPHPYGCPLPFWRLFVVVPQVCVCVCVCA